MANSDEKVSKFVQAITEYAEEQSRKIHQEVEDFKAERLLAAEKEVLIDSYQLIQKERTELNNQMSREMSRRELEARKALLAKRRDMMNAVFRQAEEKLIKYMEQPAYASRLKQALTDMAAQLPAEGTVYSVSSRDAGLLAELSALCPQGSRVEVSEDIRIGGLRGVNTTVGIVMDDTLDTRLDMQRDWFTRNSHLTVE